MSAFLYPTFHLLLCYLDISDVLWGPLDTHTDAVCFIFLTFSCPSFYILLIAVLFCVFLESHGAQTGHCVLFRSLGHSTDMICLTLIRRHRCPKAKVSCQSQQGTLIESRFFPFFFFLVFFNHCASVQWTHQIVHKIVRATCQNKGHAVQIVKNGCKLIKQRFYRGGRGGGRGGLGGEGGVEEWNTRSNINKR